jgi:1-phosphofructokinase
LNPCIDKTVTIPRLVVGGMNRVQSSRLDYVGKGVNVALNLRALGEDCACVGCIGRAGGDETIARLRGAGVATEFIRVNGDERINIKLIDSSTGRITEINESGPPVDASVYTQIEFLTTSFARRSEWLVLTGSLPTGLPKDTYARLIRAVRRAAPDCRVALDAEGEAFASSVREKPDFIKPNQYELELYCGTPCAERGMAAGEALKLIELGIPNVLVSMGADGAVWADAHTQAYAAAADVMVRSTAGAGDAMLSGWLSAHRRGAGALDAFRFAVAAAGAKVMTEGTQPITRGDVERLLSGVALEML